MGYLYGTILNVLSVVHLQTDPEGKFVADVGIFLIDKLFTNVAQSLSVTILDPTIKDLFVWSVLLDPPSIDESVIPIPIIVLQLPPRIEEVLEVADPHIVFLHPDPMNEQLKLTLLHSPPAIVDLVTWKTLPGFLIIVLQDPLIIAFHQAS